MASLLAYLDLDHRLACGQDDDFRQQDLAVWMTWLLARLLLERIYGLPKISCFHLSSTCLAVIFCYLLLLWLARQKQQKAHIPGLATRVGHLCKEQRIAEEKNCRRKEMLSLEMTCLYVVDIQISCDCVLTVNYVLLLI